MMRAQVDTSMYGRGSASRGTLGELIGAAQGISGIVGGARRRGYEEEGMLKARKDDEDDKYLNQVYGESFSGWDGVNVDDVAARNQQAYNRILQERPDLYPKAASASEGVFSALQKRTAGQQAIEEKAIEIPTKKSDLTKKLFERQKAIVDEIGEAYSEIDDDPRSHEAAITRLRLLGVPLETIEGLPSHEEYMANPGDFLARANANRSQIEKALESLTVKGKDLDVQKTGKELEWFDRNQQATIDQKGRTGRGGAGGGLTSGEENIAPLDRLAARQLAREIGGTRGQKEVYQTIIDAMQTGASIDEASDYARYKQQSEGFGMDERLTIQHITGGKLSAPRIAHLQNEFDDYVEHGTPEQIAQYLKKVTRDVAPPTQATRVVDMERTVDFLTEIEEDLKAYEAAGGRTNLFQGTMEDIHKAVGLVRDPKLRELAVRIETAVQKYRHTTTGAAFTEAEDRQYHQMFPSPKQVGALNMALINGLRRTFSGEVDHFYRRGIGESGYKKFILGEGAPAGKGEAPDDDPLGLFK